MKSNESVLKKDEKCYPPVLLEECKYIIKEKRCENKLLMT